MKTVIHETKIEGQFDVRLLQTGKSKFRYSVEYGFHKRSDLDYGEAAKEYGECIMHALQCSGALDGNGF